MHIAAISGITEKDIPREGEKMAVSFKIAATAEEFEQIHRLNYKTFVEEIPQHEPNEQKKLVDRFHAENTYLIACDGLNVVGMIAIRDRRPFSLDSKISGLEQYLPDHQAPCEIRLLAVEKKYRHGRTFFGMAQYMAKYCLAQGYDIAVMSGTVRQLKLYRQMGFVPFYKLVGSEDALYQPMYMTRETYDASLAARLHTQELSFLPGPVPVCREVAAALHTAAVSHRSVPFVETMDRVRTLLCRMTRAPHVEVLIGTGTLANDCVAANLSLRREKGLVLVNGEFGERLADHAARAGLEFSVLRQSWGQPFNPEEVGAMIQSTQAQWLWAVYGETSTGMLNDLEMLKDCCAQNGARLCLDSVSAFGVVPVDFSGVYLATGVSGKGVGSYTGLCFVFHEDAIEPAVSLPRYLDLGLYQQNNSIPFSHSSNLLQALLAALEQNDEHRQDMIRKNFTLLHREIEKTGCPVLVPEHQALPFIITIRLSAGQSSVELGHALAERGYKLHYESRYLVERNWLQISVIGRDEQEIMRMTGALQDEIVKLR